MGKTVATPFASTSHYSLLAALTDADVDPTTVKIIDSEPDDIYAAWSNDQIDGAYVWNPNLAKIVADEGKVLVSSAELAEKGDTTYDLGLVSSRSPRSTPTSSRPGRRPRTPPSASSRTTSTRLRRSSARSSRSRRPRRRLRSAT